MAGAPRLTEPEQRPAGRYVTWDVYVRDMDALVTRLDRMARAIENHFLDDARAMGASESRMAARQQHDAKAWAVRLVLAQALLAIVSSTLTGVFVYLLTR